MIHLLRWHDPAPACRRQACSPRPRRSQTPTFSGWYIPTLSESQTPALPERRACLPQTAASSFYARYFHPGARTGNLPPRRPSNSVNSFPSKTVPFSPTVRPPNSFNFNTYGPPRKCCKRKTYAKANPFKCNTYKKLGVAPSFRVPPSQPSDVQTLQRSNVQTFQRVAATLRLFNPCTVQLHSSTALFNHSYFPDSYALALGSTFQRSSVSLRLKSVSQLFSNQHLPHSYSKTAGVWGGQAGLAMKYYFNCVGILCGISNLQRSTMRIRAKGTPPSILLAKNSPSVLLSPTSLPHYFLTSIQSGNRVPLAPPPMQIVHRNV
jgi:hypothetical protein